MARHRNADCSIFIGNLDQRVTEELVWELFLQAGPVQNVHIPCDKESGKQKAFAFVEFSSSVSAHYAWELFDGIKLFGRMLTVRPQQKEGESGSLAPRNQMASDVFYKDFYNKHDELKRRPQSEPRRSRREENYYQNQNNSFCQSLNRSLSTPAQQTTYTPHWPATWQGNNPPVINRLFMGSPVGNLIYPQAQTPPSHPRYR